jgi:hypothetical protein
MLLDACETKNKGLIKGLTNDAPDLPAQPSIPQEKQAKFCV